MADEIEEVNERMLERLLDESSFLAVLFCKSNNKNNSYLLVFDQNLFLDDEDCPECEEILEELELIDGEADMYGEVF